MEENALKARIPALERELKAGHESTISVKRMYGQSILRQRRTEKECAKLQAEIEATSNKFSDCPLVKMNSNTTVSCASSSLFREDRENRIETLIDLVSLLETKIAVRTHTCAQKTLAHDHGTMQSQKIPAKMDIQMERDSLRRQLDAARAAVANCNHAPNAHEYIALSQELENAHKVAELWRSRAFALHCARERIVKQTFDEINHSQLERELLESKRMIGLLLSERRMQASDCANSLPETVTDIGGNIIPRSTRSEGARPPWNSISNSRTSLNTKVEHNRCRGIFGRHASFAYVPWKNIHERLDLFSIEAARSDGLRDILCSLKS